MAETSRDPSSSSRAGNTPSTKPKGWQPPSTEELQQLLPQYEITALLGRGGMGAVYKGTQKNLDRPVAIKILPPGMDDEDSDAQFTERFKNEARAMARLAHGSIVGVYDSGETSDGLLYIVMEFIKGTDVQKMVSEQRRLHSEHAMAITAHVCDALQYAHERGIVHRDIKPANIMVGYDGVVKVADFGLAKMSKAGESGLTRSGMAMGTLHYMAPEALMLGTSVDHRADIYAVGVMLYYMLTGKLPQGMFELPSLQVPGLDPRYDGIITKALRDDRELRYQSAAELRMDLDGILTQPVVKVRPAAQPAPAALPTEARPKAPVGHTGYYRPPVPQVEVRVEKRSAPLLWAALIVMSGLAVWMWWSRHPAAAPPAAFPAIDVAQTPVAEPPTTAVSPAHATPSASSTKQADLPIMSSAPAPQAPTAPKQTQASSTFNPAHGLAPGIWHDLFGEKLVSTSGLIPEPSNNGSNATHYRATSLYLGYSTAVFRNCVIRARFSRSQWKIVPWLMVRRNTAKDYVSGTCDDNSAVLRDHHPPISAWKTFGRAAMASAFSGEQPSLLELIAVEDRYTFSKDGKVLVEGRYAGCESGVVGLRLDPGTVIESFEIMPLDGLTQEALAAALLALKATADDPARSSATRQTPDAIPKMNVTQPTTSSSGQPGTAILSWTDSRGRTIQASFVRLAQNQVTLNVAGKESTIPLALFSTASQQQAARLAGGPGTITQVTAFNQSDSLVHRFTFSAPGEPGADIQRAAFKNGQLSLDGKPESQYMARPGPRTMLSCPEFNPSNFTLAVKLSRDRSKCILLTGGFQDPSKSGVPDPHWLSLECSSGGKLEVGLPARKFSEVVNDSDIPVGKPFILVLAGDIYLGPLHVYLDGKKYRTITLPKASDAPFTADGYFSFANYTKREALKGDVDELRVYGRVLNDVEVAALSLGGDAPLMVTASNKPVQGRNLPAQRALVTDLKNIPFPKNTSESEITAFIRQLLEYKPARGQSQPASPEDEWKNLLLDMAENHFDYVLRAVSRWDGSLSTVRYKAIQEMVFRHSEEANKSAILKALEGWPTLLEVVVAKGWKAESVPHVVAALRNFANWTYRAEAETDFLAHCLRYNEDDVWAALEALFGKDHFETSDSHFSGAVTRLSAAELKTQAARLQRLASLIWRTRTQIKRSAKPLTAIGRISCARVVVRFGVPEALDLLAEFAATGAPDVGAGYQKAQQDGVVTTLKSVTPCPPALIGAAAGQWVLERKSSLKWDLVEMLYK